MHCNVAAVSISYSVDSLFAVLQCLALIEFHYGVYLSWALAVEYLRPLESDFCLFRGKGRR